jgi:oligopeptide/dipeptide ABC transporter ATP-binding protein
VERARADVLFARPLHPYTIGLLAARPDLDAVRGDLRTPLRTIPGMVPPPQAFPSGCRFHPRCAYARAIQADGPACCTSSKRGRSCLGCSRSRGPPATAHPLARPPGCVTSHAGRVTRSWAGKPRRRAASIRLTDWPDAPAQY